MVQAPPSLRAIRGVKLELPGKMLLRATFAEPDPTEAACCIHLHVRDVRVGPTGYLCVRRRMTPGGGCREFILILIFIFICLGERGG